MPAAGITQAQLHSEFAQQLGEFRSILEVEFGKFAEKVRQGLKEELEGRKAGKSKHEVSAPAVPAKFAVPPPALARKQRQEPGGRPQTNIVAFSRSTSSSSVNNAILDKWANLEEASKESKEIDVGKVVPEADQQKLEDVSCDSNDSFGFFSRHRRGYIAGKELHDEIRLSTISKISLESRGYQTAVAAVAANDQEDHTSLDAKTGSGWQSRLPAIVNGPYFHMVATVFILLNSILLAVQTDTMARNLNEKEPAVFKVLERSFCAIFIIELALRICASGMKNFCMQEGWQWNAFDAIVVGLQGIDVVMEFIVDAALADANAESGSKDLRGNMSVLRVLRILRFVRIIRVLRTLRSVSELRTIIVSIAATFRTLMWTLVLLFLVIFMIAVTITQIVTYRLVHETNVKTLHALQTHYGSLGNSVLVLFQAITGGIDWEDMLNPLMEHLSPLLALPVCIYIGFGTFALMNIVTGVFVESALESARREKERFLLHTVKNLFSTTDEDNSGDISWDEFQGKLHTSAMHLYFKAIDLDISEAEGLFHLVDVNDSGSIDPEEFVNGCIRLQGPAKALDLATLMHEFKLSNRMIKQSHRAMTAAVATLQKPAASRYAPPVDEGTVGI